MCRPIFECFVAPAFSGMRIEVDIEIFEFFGSVKFGKTFRFLIIFTNDDVENISELFPNKDAHFS